VNPVGRRNVWAALLALAVLSCTPSKVPGQVSAAPESPAARFARDPAAVDRGRRIFIGNCGAYCHSTHHVERDAPSLFDCAWKHGGSDAEIFKSISDGVRGTRMPAWKDALPEGDDDVWRVIAYLRSASTCARRADPAPAAR
jgi:mono/diheme cytochrome c family protein